MKSIYAKVILDEEALGTAPNDAQIYENWIADNKLAAEKLQEELNALRRAMSVDEEVEKGMTVFPRNEVGDPIFWDYQIKGFLKAACGFLRDVKKGGAESEEEEEGAKKKKGGAYLSSGLTSYKKKIDGLVHIYPRALKIHINGDITLCQRPLRASTAQGERVALAISEQIPAGSWFVMEVKMIDDSHEKLIREWLDFGIFNGLGQWRNSGKGRFTWEELDEDTYNSMLA